MNTLPGVDCALNEAEERQRRNIALSSSVNRKWPSRTKHDSQCAGGHPLTSYNGLVEYPCPR